MLQALTILTNLKKICNHPRLYNLDEETRLRLNLETEPELDPEAAFDPLLSGAWERNRRRLGPALVQCWSHMSTAVCDGRTFLHVDV